MTNISDIIEKIKAEKQGIKIDINIANNVKDDININDSINNQYKESKNISIINSDNKKDETNIIAEITEGTKLSNAIHVNNDTNNKSGDDIIIENSDLKKENLGINSKIIDDIKQEKKINISILDDKRNLEVKNIIIGNDEKSSDNINIKNNDSAKDENQINASIVNDEKKSDEIAAKISANLKDKDEIAATISDDEKKSDEIAAKISADLKDDIPISINNFSDKKSGINIKAENLDDSKDKIIIDTKILQQKKDEIDVSNEILNEVKAENNIDAGGKNESKIENKILVNNNNALKNEKLIDVGYVLGTSGEKLIGDTTEALTGIVSGTLSKLTGTKLNNVFYNKDAVAVSDTKKSTEKEISVPIDNEAIKKGEDIADPTKDTESETTEDTHFSYDDKLTIDSTTKKSENPIGVNITTEDRNESKIGEIFVMPPYYDGKTKNAYTIPLQNNLKFDTVSRTASYNALKYFGRIGDIQQYTNTESLQQIQLTTTYFIDGKQDSNFCTLKDLQQIELKYKALVLPAVETYNSSSDNVIDSEATSNDNGAIKFDYFTRPPVINIKLGDVKINTGNNQFLNLFTEVDKVEEKEENKEITLKYKNFIVTDVSINKDSSIFDYYIEKGQIYDMMGFEVRLQIIEIDNEYLNSLPSFNTYFNIFKEN